MTATRWLSEDEQRTWRAFLHMQARLSARMSRDLQRSANLSLADYDVLVNLSDSAGNRLRAYELGDVLQWEQSRLSHHLARMQRRGLIAREDCRDDRRGAFIVLTDAGRQRLVDAAPAHVRTVRRLLFDDLDADSRRLLERLSAGVIARLDEDALSPASAIDIVETKDTVPDIR